ncbi:MAG: tetratricopeptide repeat protein [Rudanella sp.]|nr:tetratricopeptide repeat protein [Rudanella sp.]
MKTFVTAAFLSLLFIVAGCESQADPNGQHLRADSLLRSQRYNVRAFRYYHGNYVKAIEAYDRVLGLAPRFASGYNIRTTAKLKLGNYPGAMEDLNRAIQLDSTEAFHYANRGLLYHILGKDPQAMADLNRAIQLDPTYKLAYTNRGLAKEKLQEQQQAAQYVVVGSPVGK